MRIWVTGSGGCVGGRPVARLEGDGHEGRASDREVDVAHPDAVATARPDAVVHRAAISFIPQAGRDRLRTFRVSGARSLAACRGVAAGRGERVVNAEVAYARPVTRTNRSEPAV